MSNAPRPALAVRFGLFADPHYAEKVYGNRHCEDSAAKLEACVETLAAEDLDFAVCMGDAIDSGEDREEELGYLGRMREVFAGCGVERHWVLGNHDLDSFTKAEFLEACGSGRGAHYSFDQKGTHFAVLDGNCHEDGSDFSPGNFEWDQAWLSPAQLEWLKADLAATSKPAVVLCHENLDDRLHEGEPDPHVLRNADQVRVTLQEAGNVRAVIQGHYHPGLLTWIGDIRA